jgi:hypothetical protein
MVNSPTGVITSRVSPAFSISQAYVEKAPPGSFFTPTRSLPLLALSANRIGAADVVAVDHVP